MFSILLVWNEDSQSSLCLLPVKDSHEFNRVMGYHNRYVNGVGSQNALDGQEEYFCDSEGRFRFEQHKQRNALSATKVDGVVISGKKSWMSVTPVTMI